MILRADHIAGGLFVAVGVLVFAVSGDLPFGSLSFPGAGFMPLIVAALLIVMGVLLALAARESAPFRELGWGDLAHAGAVIALTTAAIALYARIGFVLTLPLLLFALLVLVERKSIFAAGVFSLSVTALAYALFHYLLHAPIPRGPFGFF